MINKNKMLASFLGIFLIVSCSMDESSDQNASVSNEVYFNEFMECKAGPDMSEENLTAMISEWQKLLTAEELMGVWGYGPASEDNSWGDSGWWEIQWTSKEAADSAWSEWSSNEAALKWAEKYSNVLQCDGPGRFAFDGTFPIPFNTYGEANDSGYFYGEFYGCTYNEGSSREDAVAFAPGFNNAVAKSDYADTRYHYGNYFAYDNENVDFIWGSFTNSKASNDKANASFAADVRDEMFPLFSEFASCTETADVYHGWTLYDSSNKDFMPTFSFNN